MKHRNIKERRRDISEFAYRNRVNILVIEYQRQRRNKRFGFTLKMTEPEEKIISAVRKEIGYSEKTLSFDIWLMLIKITKKVLQYEPTTAKY